MWALWCAPTSAYLTVIKPARPPMAIQTEMLSATPRTSPRTYKPACAASQHISATKVPAATVSKTRTAKLSGPQMFGMRGRIIDQDEHSSDNQFSSCQHE